MNQNTGELLRNVSRELKVLETARNRYAKQLAPNFSIFNYISTDEVMLSRIIADLLDPKGNHSQGDLFLKLFLSQLSNASIYENLDLQQAEICREAITFRNNTQRRMDLYIQIPLHTANSKFGICIENKPYATDQEKQLTDYAKEMSQRHKNSQWHIVYLTGNGNDPNTISVDTSTLENWKNQKSFTAIHYPQLIEWLNKCKTTSQNERVNTFLTAFSTFITKQFLGIEDMSEQQNILNLITSSDEYIYAAFEIIAAKEKIQDQLVKEFETQLINACVQKNWYVNGHFSRNKQTGLTISFESPHQHINYTIQFYANDYADFLWGLAKSNAEYNDPELWISIHQTMTEHFGSEKVKQSDWWPYFIDKKYPFNWQSHHDVWRMIRSGELCNIVMHYTEKTYQILKEHKLLTRL